MAVLTHDLVRNLAGRTGGSSPVVSCYLDVDGRTHRSHADIEREAEVALRRARARANGSNGVSRDLDRIDEFIRGGFDRAGVRGLAIFSCLDADLWEVMELPVPVRTQVVVADSPHVRQLEAVLDTNDRFGVLLVDRKRVRLFVFELGELVERDELVDEIPRDVDDDRAFEADRRAAHLDAHVHQHLKHAAQVAFRACQDLAVDHLIVGVASDLQSELESCLHPYVRDRVAGHVNVPVAAADAQIVAAALEVEAEVERRRAAALVARLRDAAGSNGRAVLGLEPVLAALNGRRVDCLVVSRGYERSGWQCPGCDALALVGPTCKVCGAQMRRVEDIVEEAEEAALAAGSNVAVCVDDADLDVAGRIGAFLRF